MEVGQFKHMLKEQDAVHALQRVRVAHPLLPARCVKFVEILFCNVSVLTDLLLRLSKSLQRFTPDHNYQSQNWKFMRSTDAPQ